MKDLLDKLIDESDEGVVSCQIQIGFQITPGAVRRSDLSDQGIYEMLVVTSDPHGVPKGTAVMHFCADQVAAVMIPDEEPRIKPVSGGLITPRS